MSTGHFAAEYELALELVAEAGVPVTFDQTSVTYVHAPTDETSTPKLATVTGSAVRVKGKPIAYRTDSLVETESPTLLFVPNTYGVLPELGALLVDFGGLPYTVAAVDPIAPDGVALAARLVVSR